MRLSRMMVLALAACGAPVKEGRAPGDTDTDTDTGPDTDTDTGPDTVEVPEDNVANALGDCVGHYEEPDAYPNQLAAGSELQRYTLRNPEALCNDGTPAVLYVRPATDPVFADVWELHLQGGGACSGWATCAERWCGLGYYDSSKMSSNGLPEQVAGFGIFDEDPANLIAGANHVYFYYCSSDSWGGQGSVRYEPPEVGEDTAGEVEIPADLPAYTMLTRGHTIVEAALDELEAGVESDLGEAMPSLRDASVVLWNGTSAGSAGAIRHADWVSARLGENGTRVFGVFDAALSPPHEYFSGSAADAFAAYGETAWDTRVATSDTLPFVDASCGDLLGDTAEAWRCDHAAYLILNHITTPFFARQDLRDIGDGAVALGIPEDDWEVAVRAMLLDLSAIASDGVEGDAVTVAPGAYGPNCGQHVALEMSDWWRGGTVEGDDGVRYTFQAAVAAWYQGGRVVAVDDAVVGEGPGPRSDCAAVDGAH